MRFVIYTSNLILAHYASQEELMFEDFANPPKGKGKEKDVGRRRAYVRVVTSLGGSLNLELFCEKVRNSEQEVHAIRLIVLSS